MFKQSTTTKGTNGNLLIWVMDAIQKREWGPFARSKHKSMKNFKKHLSCLSAVWALNFSKLLKKWKVFNVHFRLYRLSGRFRQLEKANVSPRSCKRYKLKAGKVQTDLKYKAVNWIPQKFLLSLKKKKKSLKFLIFFPCSFYFAYLLMLQLFKSFQLLGEKKPQNHCFPFCTNLLSLPPPPVNHLVKWSWAHV